MNESNTSPCVQTSFRHLLRSGKTLKRLKQDSQYPRRVIPERHSPIIIDMAS